MSKGNTQTGGKGTPEEPVPATLVAVEAVAAVAVVADHIKR